MSRLSVILVNMESKFRFSLHQEITSNVWHFLYRDPIRYVDFRYKNIQYSPGRFEEVGYRKKKDIHAERPTIQSRSKCTSSDDYICIPKRKWEDMTANEYSHRYDLRYQISKFSRKLIRCEYRHRKQIDNSFEIRSWNLKIYLMKIESIISGRLVTNHYFSTDRILVVLYCTFILFKDALEENWSNHSWWVM